MEITRVFFVVLMILILNNIIEESNATPIGDSLVNKALNGKELVKMGTVLNKPLMTLLGETFITLEQNIEQNNLKRQELYTKICKLKTCSEWSEWTQCSATLIKTFGARTRTRSCGGTSSICPSNTTETEETESKICQGELDCKSRNYTLTENGFCIRLSNTVRKSRTDAQDECHQDGGHLINIDSGLKAADVNTTLQAVPFIVSLWNDGTRTLPNGEWKYEYGSEDTNFSIWRSGEPGSTDDCKVYARYGVKWVWYGRSCSTKYYFLCEIF